ncbi:hypothetical protein LO772_06560 [Yinghuangia sp. ASG 101]|uniref:hypothetical protein n=1 Tax=Yinghuangia sp. ASG 101 TaxID=2896848 RepID=UPI001E497AA2|nr:hypothetical protein [Yinghuangia sp. ASG 101]UGQ13275.1 hypothetical protein LO772_06560 [Yinghuangia sp. ASG 101]
MTPRVHRLCPRTARPRGPEGSTVLTHDSRQGIANAWAAAVAGFALDAGLTRLAVDNPMKDGFFSFSVRAARNRQGLGGLFPYDLTGYHDGALVPLGTAMGLVRAMVLREGTWCRLIGDDGFFVHVGTRDDVYVGTATASERAVSHARALGLSVDRVDASPWDPALDHVDEHRPADAEFWTHVTQLTAEHGGILVEEQHIRNAYTWHRPVSVGDGGRVVVVGVDLGRRRMVLSLRCVGG